MTLSRRKPPGGRPEAPKTRQNRAKRNGSQPSNIIDLGWDVAEVSRRVEREPGPPETLPRADTLLLWQRLLREDHRALRWLHKRGLSNETIARFGLGFHYGSRHAITIPLVGEDGTLYNLKRRYLDGIDSPQRPKYKALRGQPHGLYPDVPEGRTVLLCEGEFDALLARQHGLPALTGTAGIDGWRDGWSRRFRGRRVAVAFDAGPRCYELACERAARLSAAGAAEAWPVDLTLAGLRPGEDLTDWFVTYGWSGDELSRFIAANREWAREAS